MYTLADLLKEASDHRLTHLMSRHGIAGAALTREQMQGRIANRLADPSYLRSRLKELSHSHLLALRFAIVHGGWYRTQQATADVLGKQAESLADDLRTLGFMGSSAVPVEVMRAAVRLWAESLIWPGGPPKGVAAPDPTGPGAMRDLFAMLAMAGRKGLPLTQQQSLFRKAAEELLRSMEGGATPRNDLLLNTIIEYASARGLIGVAVYDRTGTKAKMGLAPTALVETWTRLPWSAIWADMASYSIDSLRTGFAGWSVALQTLALAPAGAWLSADDWMDSLDSLAGARDWPPLHGGALEIFLSGLEELQLVQLHERSSGSALVRATPALSAILAGSLPVLPAPTEHFVVQPTFAIVAPKTLSPAVLYRLEQLTEDRCADGALQYTLSFGSLRPAIEGREKPEEIIGFFEAHSQTPLASNVLAELRSWTSKGTQARFESAMLLRLSDPHTAAMLMADKKIQGAVLSAVSPTDLIVDAGSVEKIRKRLVELGLVTNPGVGTPGAPPSPEASFPVIATLTEKPQRLCTPAASVDRWFGGPLQLTAPTAATAAPDTASPVKAKDQPAVRSRVPANQAECAAWLRAHAAARETVRIGYDSEGNVKEYTVRPERVLGDRLVGFCEEAGGDRTFKLARISSVEVASGPRA